MRNLFCTVFLKRLRILEIVANLATLKVSRLHGGRRVMHHSRVPWRIASYDGRGTRAGTAIDAGNLLKVGLVGGGQGSSPRHVASILADGRDEFFPGVSIVSSRLLSFFTSNQRNIGKEKARPSSNVHPARFHPDLDPVIAAHKVDQRRPVAAADAAAGAAHQAF